MFNFILDKLLGRELEIKERIFRAIILIGGIVSVAGIFEGLLVSDVSSIICPVIVLLFAMGFALYATFKYHKVDFSAMVLGFILICMIFPTMFFLSGGLYGGATVWFAIGLFYGFLMFNGWKLKIFVALDILVMAACYLTGYLHPEYIVPVLSPALAYIDSFFSVTVVGVACGIIYHFQIKIFQTERTLIKKQSEKLQAIADSRSKFFSNMSYEFRTPLNTIIGMNEMIKRESSEGNIVDYAENISNAGNVLLSLVNDIIDLSKIEMGETDIVNEKYRTGEMLYNLVDIIDVRMKEKNLTFNLDIDENLPSVLMGDVEHIKQIMLHLLTNAVKYTEKGSVTLSVYFEKIDDETIRLNLSVEDTGIGIRKEDIALIYDIFERINSEGNKSAHGTGLGLTITKKLVNLLGGEITVDSIYRKGSSFTVKINQKIVNEKPLGNFVESAKAVRNSENYGPSFEAPEARILIVDDSKMNAYVTKKLLEATNMQVDVVESAEQCLKMTRMKYYHVILMDYLMPDMDGGEALRQIRAQENGLCRESAVVVITAATLTDSVRICEENNFDGYIEKPVQGAKLEKEIMKYLPEDIIEYTNVFNPENSLMIQSVHGIHKKKVCITTDCVCDLPKELLEKYDIGLMYLYIQTPSGRFTDTKEISSDNLAQYMDGDKITAKSGSVSVQEYEEFFADALTRAQQVIHLSVPQKCGQNYAMATQAAEGFDNVHVIDSSLISGGLGLLVLYASKLAKEGYGVEEILKLVEKNRNNIDFTFIVQNSNIFLNSGYTSLAKPGRSLIGNTHPVIGVRQSKLTVTNVMWGSMENSWKHYIRSRLKNKNKICTNIVIITHVGCSTKQIELIKQEVLKYVPFERMIVQKASFSNSCNTGKYTISISFFANLDKEDETFI